jgi:tRNA modification GTPase
MLGKLSGWDDTIVALATPQGVGAIGVVRISGDKAIEYVNQIFPSKELVVQPSHTVHVGLLKHEGIVIDQVVISLFKEPASYTGENIFKSRVFCKVISL